MIAWQSASNRLTFERDVVVDEEDGPRAAATRVADVGEDALDRIGVEVAPAHLDDRAEAAVERAAARGLHDVDLASEQRVAAEHAGRAVRRPDRRRRSDWPTGAIGVVEELVAVAERQAGDLRRARSPRSMARTSSRNVTSPSPRTMKSTPRSGSV